MRPSLKKVLTIAAWVGCREHTQRERGFSQLWMGQVGTPGPWTETSQVSMAFSLTEENLETQTMSGPSPAYQSCVFK